MEDAEGLLGITNCERRRQRVLNKKYVMEETCKIASRKVRFRRVDGIGNCIEITVCQAKQNLR